MKEQETYDYNHCCLCKKKSKNPIRHLRLEHNSVYEHLLYYKIPWQKYFQLKLVTDEIVHSYKGQLLKVEQELVIAHTKDSFTRKENHQGKTASFIWEDILFKNKAIQIYIQRHDRRFLPITCSQSIEVLNKIKEEFFIRNHGNKLYKLNAIENKILIDKSPDVQEILNLVDAAVDLYNFRYQKKSSRYLSESSLRSMTNEQILNIFNKDVDKAPYIKFLYSKHCQEYKLIPILESIGSSNEESFLFRIKAKNENTYVVWENINPARATYIFKIKSKAHLRNILSYISEHEQSKRLYLRNNLNKDWSFNQLGYVGYIDHEGLGEYKQALKKLIE